MRGLYQFSVSRLSWSILLLGMIILELCGLYFQHGMQLSPCVMCIYERVALMAMGLTALVVLINPKNTVLRWFGFISWGTASAMGLSIAIEHTNLQLNPSPFSACPLFVEFPSWLPLDKWVPWMFEAYGECSEIAWTMLGWSMPQWLIVAFGTNLLILSVMVLSQFMGKRKEASLFR